MWPPRSRNPTGFAAAVMVLALSLAGCGTQSIVVAEAALTDRPEAPVVGWTASEEPQLVFSPEDEEITLKVLFAFNYRAIYEWYKVEWISPDGSPYQVVSLRTDFASHRDLKASLKVRGKMASRMPGVWRVRIWLLGREGAPDRLLVSRLFRIEEATPQMLAAGMTPVDPPAAGAERPLAAALASGPAPAPVPAPDIAPPAPAAGAAGGAPAAGEVPAPPASGPAPATSPLAAPPSVLPPLAVPTPAGVVASAPAGLAPAAGDVPGPADPAAGPLPASGVSAVTLSATQSVPQPDGEARRAPLFSLCPSLYYPPGPGCVEQAPEE